MNTTKKPNRKRPPLGITVDQDVKDWIIAESEKHRLKPSQFVNQLLAAEKDKQQEHDKKMGAYITPVKDGIHITERISHTPRAAEPRGPQPPPPTDPTHITEYPRIHRRKK